MGEDFQQELETIEKRCNMDGPDLKGGKSFWEGKYHQNMNPVIPSQPN